MAVLEIEGRKVEVDDGFRDLSPEQQAATVEQIARQMGIAPGGRDGNGVMGQVNRGIAQGIGGLVDFVNPLDDLGVTGSATEGLMSGMRAINADVADRPPEGMVENFAYGTGSAAATALPVAKGAQLLSRAPGAIGRVAGDAYRSLGTRTGAVTEAAAGGIAQGAESMARDAGAPEWAQQSAAVLAPMAVAGAGAAAVRTPGVTVARRGVRAAAETMAPYTRSGAREVARTRIQQLAGGPERAEMLGARIAEPSDLPLTPAQKTGDPNMLGLERLAADQDPNIRERLDARREAAGTEARNALTVDGDVEATRDVFRQRQRAFATDLTTRANEAVRRAESRVRSVGPQRGEGENSRIVVDEVRKSLDEATAVERDLWAAVPQDAPAYVAASRSAAMDAIEKTPRAQAADVPQAVRRFLGEDGEFGNVETVAEMHGLYSELRRVARSAMAGNDVNKNRARIANNVAEAILRDLGAKNADDEVGRAINEARAYSAALHETFDRGAVGKILQRTLDGDTQLEPRLVLDRTVGRGGEAGAVSGDQIRGGVEFGGGDAQTSDSAVMDYVRERFSLAAETPTGEFTLRGARKFARDNRVLLDQYPGLRDEIEVAVRNRERADQLQARVTDAIAASRSAQSSAMEAFLGGPPEKAIDGVFRNQNPARAARSLLNAAAKDDSGQAVAGLKRAVADRLIGRATSGAGRGVDAERLAGTLDDPAMQRVMRVVFSDAERTRFNRIAKELRLATSDDAANVGTSLSGARANRLLEYAVRVVAARQGAELGGGGGGSLQTAQMASSRAKEMLGRLASDKASQLLADAVEDPELFRSLLVDPRSARFERETLPRILPYLMGGATAAASDDQREGPQ